MSELLFWLWLTNKPGIGSSKISKLLEYFMTPEDVWRATKPQLKEIGILNEKDITCICDKRLDNSKELLDNMKRYEISAVTMDNSLYPLWLKHIFNPPYLLYVRGKLLPDDEASLGVVGSRNASAYGKKIGGQLSCEAAKHGITIVSGMARGIDTCAHKGALNAGGRTVAVLGCGVDIVYPKENSELMSYIIKSGAVISEYPPGTFPNSANFPARNRIISGMSFATLVIEAGERSGSLITADFALEQGRNVLAVPGNVDVVSSKGTNNLIKQGAKLVSCIDDIIEEVPEHIIDMINRRKGVNNNFSKIDYYNEEEKHREVHLPDDVCISSEEKNLLVHLSDVPLHIEELATKSGCGMQELNSLLTLLEMKGIVNQLAGKTFSRNM